MKVKLFLRNKTRVHEIMAFKGYTQPSLAEAAETSTSYINKIINGNMQPQPPLARRICDALGVTIEDLFYAQSGYGSNQNGDGETQEEEKGNV